MQYNADNLTVEDQEFEIYDENEHANKLNVKTLTAKIHSLESLVEDANTYKQT